MSMIYRIYKRSQRGLDHIGTKKELVDVPDLILEHIEKDASSRYMVIGHDPVLDSDCILQMFVGSDIEALKLWQEEIENKEQKIKKLK